MYFSGPIAYRHSAYLLACQEMLARHEPLRQAGNWSIPHEQCVAKFNDALTTFFGGDHSRDLAQATSQLRDCLIEGANKFRQRNPGAAEIFRDLAEAVAARSSNWDTDAEFGALHIAGRDAGRRFLAGSPWAITQERLRRTCELNHVFTGCKTDTGYCPLSCCVEADTASIQLYFTYQHTFDDYLAYVPLFVHEYTAHVFSTDNNSNPQFNEGWIVYAAAAHILRERELAYEQSRYNFATMVPPWNPASQKVMKFTMDVASLLQESDVFEQITYELAAYDPNAQQPNNWPDTFINVLWLAYKVAREDELRDILTNYSNTRSIGEALVECPSIIDGLELSAGRSSSLKNALIDHGLL